MTKAAGVKTWEAYFPTVGDLVAIGGGLFGVVLLVLVPILAINPGSVPEAGVGCVIGLVMIGGGFWVLLAPARRVEIDVEGVATFIRRRRSLVVSPGELESISAVQPFSAAVRGRRIPMLVVARRGKIRLQTPADAEGLFKALAQSNPEAHLDRARDWL